MADSGGGSVVKAYITNNIKVSRLSASEFKERMKNKPKPETVKKTEGSLVVGNEEKIGVVAVAETTIPREIIAALNSGGEHGVVFDPQSKKYYKRLPPNPKSNHNLWRPPAPTLSQPQPLSVVTPVVVTEVVEAVEEAVVVVEVATPQLESKEEEKNTDTLVEVDEVKNSDNDDIPIPVVVAVVEGGAPPILSDIQYEYDNEDKITITFCVYNPVFVINVSLIHMKMVEETVASAEAIVAPLLISDSQLLGDGDSLENIYTLEIAAPHAELRKEGGVLELVVVAENNDGSDTKIMTLQNIL